MAVHEKKLGKNLIGTTKRGVGPTYMDKMNRTGLRIQDMLDEKIFRKKLEAALEYTNPILSLVYGLPTYTVDQIARPTCLMQIAFVLTLLSLLSSSTKSLRLVRTFSLRALRQPCLILTTAPIHLLPLLAAPLVAQ